MQLHAGCAHLLESAIAVTSLTDTLRAFVKDGRKKAIRKKLPGGATIRRRMDRLTRTSIVLPVACVALLACGACAKPASGQTGASKVLFIGDSFTYTQGGLWTHFTELAAAANPPRAVTTDKAVQGGAFLKVLWELETPVKAIDTGNFDVVVLQDDIPETNPDYFKEYARKFVNEVRKNHARPVLLMAWAYDRLGWITMDEIATLHRDLGKELGVDVAPVGLAWQRSMAQRPQLDMYAGDREHESIHGMYLAACVLYATVYNADPTGLKYAPSGVSRDDAQFLQKIAWDTMREYTK